MSGLPLNTTHDKYLRMDRIRDRKVDALRPAPRIFSFSGSRWISCPTGVDAHRSSSPHIKIQRWRSDSSASLRAEDPEYRILCNLLWKRRGSRAQAKTNCSSIVFVRCRFRALAFSQLSNHIAAVVLVISIALSFFCSRERNSRSLPPRSAPTRTRERHNSRNLGASSNDPSQSSEGSWNPSLSSDPSFSSHHAHTIHPSAPHAATRL